MKPQLSELTKLVFAVRSLLGFFSSTIINLILISALSGCASLPNAQQSIQIAADSENPVEIQNTHQELSDKAVEKKIKKLTPDEEVRESLEQHLKIEQSISDSTLFTDNNVQILFNGENTFDAMFKAIDSAKETINLEYFIFEDVDFNGESLTHLLTRKVAEGVSVNVIYDAIGSDTTPLDFFENLKKNGVNFTAYHPLKPGFFLNVNNRDHRKIMVIDGKLAIVGGVNISKTYESKGSGINRFSKHPEGDVSNTHWRDTDAIIQGPVVAEIQRIFLSHWDNSQPIDQTKFFPVLQKQGNELVRAIPTDSSKNEARDSPYYITLISAIQNAQHSITLNSAYFVPTREQQKALIQAAQRGVKVDLLLPSISDSKLALNVQHSRYDDLLEHGVNIYEIQDEILHAKVVSIDGVWSVIGSSNFDYRSAGLNAEVDFVILGKETSRQLVERFNQDISKAKRIDYETWKNRPLMDKLKQTLSRLFEGIL